MKSLIYFLFPLALVGCNLFNDKVVIDTQTGGGSTIENGDVFISIDSNQSDSAVLNFGVLSPQMTISKIIEVKNDSNDLQQFNLLTLDAGPFTVVSNTCGTELQPHSTCRIQVEASSPEELTITLPLKIQKGNTVKTVYLVASPLEIMCPNGFHLSDNLCLADNAPFSFSYATATVIASSGSVVSVSPSLSGGSAPYTVSVSPSLPTGLSIDSQGNISGTASVISSAQSYLFTAKDSLNVTKTASLTISVVNNCPANYTLTNGVCTQNDAPLALSYAQNSKNFLVGLNSEISASASGGTPPYSFTVNPSLPNGLLLNASNGTISGSATATSTSSNFTVTMTDDKDESITSDLSISVSNPCPTNFFLQNGACVQNELQLAINYPVSSSTLILGVPFNTIPSISGGTAPYSLTISPALPAGLVFNSFTGRISGSVSSLISNEVHTITVNDDNNHSVSTTFTISSEVLTNLSIAYTWPSAGVFVGTSYAINPVISGGLALNYVLNCPNGLPSGFTFSTVSGNFSGTPSLSQVRDCTVSTQDILGRTASTLVSWNIQNIPLVLTYSLSTINVPVGGSVNTTPSLEGGIATSYSISPGLTRGLSINTTTGLISGTVTGLGDFSQVYTITASTGVRSTSTTVSISFTYAPELVNDTVSVSLNNSFVKIINDESHGNLTEDMQTLSSFSQDSYATLEENDAKVILLPPPPAIDSMTDLTPRPLALTTLDNTPNSIIYQGLDTNKFNYSTIKINISNTGQEYLSTCKAFNIPTGTPYNCSTGQSTASGSSNANQLFSLEFKYLNGAVDVNINSLSLTIEKQYGSSKTFTLNDDGSPVISAKRLTTNNLGISPANVYFGHESVLGEQRFTHAASWASQYNGNIYFLLGKKLINGINANIIYKYDGTTLTQVVKMQEDNSGYAGSIFAPVIYGNNLYFSAVYNYSFRFFRYDLENHTVSKISSETGASSGPYRSREVPGGVLFTDSTGTFLFDPSIAKSYKIANVTIDMEDLSLVDDGFIYSAVGQGAYYAKYTANDTISVRKIAISNTNAFAGCRSITKYQNYITLICPPVSYGTLQNKFYAYNTLTNTLEQVSNISSINDTDLVNGYGTLPSLMQVLENKSILFFSRNANQAMKLYKIKGNVLTKISNFTGSETASDEAGTSMYVRGNKAFFSMWTPAFSKTCLIEYDDEKLVNPYRIVTCDIPSNSNGKGMDEKKNLYIFDYLIYNDIPNTQVSFGGKIYDSILWFGDGKVIFHNAMKYYYFDGTKTYQISDTISSPTIADMEGSRAFAMVYKGKILYIGKDVNSNLPQLWEVTLPPQIAAPAAGVL